MRPEIDDVEFDSVALSDERGRDFDEWVTNRLSEWATADIRAFDGWLLAESHFEFIPAVRAAWQDRLAEEFDRHPAARASTTVGS